MEVKPKELIRLVITLDVPFIPEHYTDKEITLDKAVEITRHSLEEGYLDIDSFMDNYLTSIVVSGKVE